MAMYWRIIQDRGLLMFGELVNEIKSAFGGTITRKIIVAKPYCTPARDCITGALQPYGVVVHGFREYTEQVNHLGRMVPALQVAEVTVSAQAASWAEYLLLRSGKFRVYGEYQDVRNEAWATKHAGQMPPAWKAGKPWIEKSCSAGIEAWKGAKKKR